MVYRESGLPAYEGQAMVEASCGSSAFCHAADASGASRFGAPAGLNFDMTLVDPSFGAEGPQRERLAAGLADMQDRAVEAYDLVESGEMPPFGEDTEGLFDGAPRFFHADGTRVHPIDSVDGLARFRNWLACDAPVVEGTTGSGTVGDIVPAR